MIIDTEKILTRTKFVKKLKYLSRGLNDTRVLEEMLKYYNNSEKYISELETENFRLSVENEKLKQDVNKFEKSALDGWSWLQSLALRKCNGLQKELGIFKK